VLSSQLAASSHSHVPIAPHGVRREVEKGLRKGRGCRVKKFKREKATTKGNPATFVYASRHGY